LNTLSCSSFELEKAIKDFTAGWVQLHLKSTTSDKIGLKKALWLGAQNDLSNVFERKDSL